MGLFYSIHYDIHIYKYYLLNNHLYIPLYLLLIYFYLLDNFHLQYNDVYVNHQNNNNMNNFHNNLYHLNNNYQYTVNIDDYNYLQFLYILYNLNNKAYMKDYNYQIYTLMAYY